MRGDLRLTVESTDINNEIVSVLNEIEMRVVARVADARAAAG
jgi:hypothetical protein